MNLSERLEERFESSVPYILWFYVRRILMDDWWRKREREKMK